MTLGSSSEGLGVLSAGDVNGVLEVDSDEGAEEGDDSDSEDSASDEVVSCPSVVDPVPAGSAAAVALGAASTAACGSGKMSSPRSCTTFNAALR